MRQRAGWLRRLPDFRGSSQVYSRLAYILPTSRYVEMAQESISLDLRDAVQFQIALDGGVYEGQTTLFFKARLKPGDLFIDVGANWGYFTCLAAHLVERTGHVVAIEPLPMAHRRLLATIRRHGLTNVTAIREERRTRTTTLCG